MKIVLALIGLIIENDNFYCEFFSNFSNYKARFNMPGDTESLFYSFNMGPVHFISFTTEFYYVRSISVLFCFTLTLFHSGKYNKSLIFFT